MRSPLRKTLRGLVSNAGKARRIIASPAISDHWKEVALPKLAMRMLRSSLTLLLILLVIFAPIVLVDLIGRLMGVDVIGSALTLTGTIAIILIAWAYLGLIRKRLNV